MHENYAAEEYFALGRSWQAFSSFLNVLLIDTMYPVAFINSSNGLILSIVNEPVTKEKSLILRKTI